MIVHKPSNSLILKLRDRLGIDAAAMRANHTNLE